MPTPPRTSTASRRTRGAGPSGSRRAGGVLGALRAPGGALAAASVLHVEPLPATPVGAITPVSTSHHSTVLRRHQQEITSSGSRIIRCSHRIATVVANAATASPVPASPAATVGPMENVFCEGPHALTGLHAKPRTGVCVCVCVGGGGGAWTGGVAR